jgi:hypothetical protein
MVTLDVNSNTERRDFAMTVLTFASVAVWMRYQNIVPQPSLTVGTKYKVSVKTLLHTESLISDHTTQTVLEQVGNSLRTSKCNN